MKLLLAITTLFATSAVAKYSPGQDCRTNKGCDQNCPGSKWSVIIEDGDARMVCDSTTLDSTRYITASCKNGITKTWDDISTKAACDVVKGKFCSHSCFFTTKASKEEASTHSFEKECYPKDGLILFPRVNVYPTIKKAVEGSFGDCDSIFSSKEL